MVLECGAEGSRAMKMQRWIRLKGHMVIGLGWEQEETIIRLERSGIGERRSMELLIVV